MKPTNFATQGRNPTQGKIVENGQNRVLVTFFFPPEFSWVGLSPWVMMAFVGFHVIFNSSAPVTIFLKNRVFAIYQILLGWKTYKYCYETDELPNPRQTQPKKK